MTLAPAKFIRSFLLHVTEGFPSHASLRLMRAQAKAEAIAMVRECTPAGADMVSGSRR
jgi:hypothetical protein